MVMNQAKKKLSAQESNLLDLLVFKFLPYWPVLVFSLVVCFAAAMLYMRLALPTYAATATLLVKDEKKGSDDPRMIDALNVFGTKKIVENEIEVIQSRTLMKGVVKNLALYAPISMQSKIRTLSAYTTSPITIKVKDPDKIIETDKVYFTFDGKSETVKMGGQKYSLNIWVNTPYGELMFLRNIKLKTVTTNLLYVSFIPPKLIVNNLIGKLSVSAVNKLSSVVSLQFVDEVPERAEDIINCLISEYNRAGINDKNALADNTMQFVDERLKHVKSEIDSIEKQVQVYRSQQGAINLSEQSSVFLKNVGDNDQKAALIDMQLAVLNQVQRFVNSGKSIGNIVPSTLGITDPVLSQLLTRLSNTELEYEKLKNTTGQNNPVLISLSNELKQLRPNILENIRVQIINLKTSSEQISETNKKYSEVLQSIPEKERKLLEISRQQTIINNVYNFLLQKKEETALSYASTVPDSRVLDAAEASVKPNSPKKIIAFPAALIAAIAFSFAVIYIKDFASNKILFTSEIEQISDVSVLGEIGFFKNKSAENSKKETVLIKEQLFKVIASIGLFNKNNSIKKIMFTSSIAGEGKSFVCINLAKVLTEAGKKVVIVDLDFSLKTVSNTFFTDKGNGVAEYLLGDCEVYDTISHTNNNIFVVRAGELHSNFASLFSNGRIETLFSFLEQSFDVILIDTSSIDPITDDLILSQFSDKTLYIVRHAYTPKSIFKFKNAAISRSDLDKIGIVFNGIKSRGFLKGHGYGYGHDYIYKQKGVKENVKTPKDSLQEEMKS